MENSFYEITESINNLTSENYISTITAISKFKDMDIKKELYETFIEKIKEMIINNEYESDLELENEIITIYNDLISLDPFVEGVLKEKEFNFYSLKKESENISEFERINKKITILGNEYSLILTKQYLIDELTKILDQTNNELLKVKEEINEIKSSNNISTINEKISIIEVKEKSLEEDIENITQDLNILNETIEILTEENLKVLSKKYNIPASKINNNKKNILNTINTIQKEQENLASELDNLNNELNNLSEKDYKDISLEELTNELNELKETRENLVVSTDWIYKKDVVIEDGINLKEKFDNLDEKIEKIERKINIENNIETNKRKIADLNNLNKLNYTKSTYTSILKEATVEYENTNKIKDLDKKVDNFINNHLRIDKINSYKNSSKLKKELQIEILDKIEPKVIEKAEKRKKLWLKALAGTTGFIAGLGFSCVPGVGTIRMGIATTKLAITATNKIINICTKNNQVGISQKVKKVVEPYINKINIRYPKLIPTINKTKEKLKNPYIQCAINGLAAGYIVGNVVEMITGSSISEHISERLNLSSNNIESDLTTKVPQNSVEELPKTDEYINSENGQIIDKKPIIEQETIIKNNLINHSKPIVDDIVSTNKIIPKQGDIVDLSNITKGYTSADSSKMVNIMESLGKEVAFDKAVELSDGRIMWHFKRLNGAGYAWFDSEVVQELLSAPTKTISR